MVGDLTVSPTVLRLFTQPNQTLCDRIRIDSLYIFNLTRVQYRLRKTLEREKKLFVQYLVLLSPSFLVSSQYRSNLKASSKTTSISETQKGEGKTRTVDYSM